jgi:HEAT repeat protein
MRYSIRIIAVSIAIALLGWGAPTLAQVSKKPAKKTTESTEKSQEKKKKTTDKKAKTTAEEESEAEFEPNDLEFDKLKEQFDEEKAKEPHERIETIKKFGDYPTKRTIPFLTSVIADEKIPIIVGAVVEALGKLGTREAVEKIVLEGAPLLIGDYAIGSLAKALANPAMEDDAEEWLIKNGMTPEMKKDKEASKIMVNAIASLKSEKRIPFLQTELKKATTSEAKVIFLNAIREAKPKDAGKLVGPLLKDPDPNVQVAALGVLFEAKARSSMNDCVNLVKSKNWQVRAMAVDCLAVFRHPEFVRIAEPLLEDPEVRVRIGVVQAFATIGGDAVMAPLIRAMGKKDNEGRVLDDIADALARFTGKNFGPNPANWESWWTANKGKVKIQRMSSEDFAKVKESDKEQKTAVYFGLRVISKNIAFVFDTSASMSEAYVLPSERKEEAGPPAEPPEKTTAKKLEKKASPGSEAAKPMVKKIEVAKSELTKVLNSLQMGIKVNIIRFNTLIEPWKDALAPLTGETKKDALSYVNASTPDGMTNVYGALETALKDEKVDTIYLLSDGEPTVGEYIETEDLLEAVARLNQLQKVKINTIGFHLKAEERHLMQELAERNFGVFLSR